MIPTTDLPVEEVVDALRDALRERTEAVLVAPPGAGKTTLVPLRLVGEPWLAGRKIVMLEPRRLAARGGRVPAGLVCSARSPAGSSATRPATNGASGATPGSRSSPRAC